MNKEEEAMKEEWKNKEQILQGYMQNIEGSNSDSDSDCFEEIVIAQKSKTGDMTNEIRRVKKISNS